VDLSIVVLSSRVRGWWPLQVCWLLVLLIWPTLFILVRCMWALEHVVWPSARKDMPTVSVDWAELLHSPLSPSTVTTLFLPCHWCHPNWLHVPDVVSVPWFLEEWKLKYLYSVLRTIKLPNRQGKTVAFQWVPSHIGLHGNETANLLAKKRNHTSKQTPLNFETIKRLIKQKNTRKILQGSYCLIQQDTVAKH